MHTVVPHCKAGDFVYIIVQFPFLRYGQIKYYCLLLTFMHRIFPVDSQVRVEFHTVVNKEVLPEQSAHKSMKENNKNDKIKGII